MSRVGDLPIADALREDKRRRRRWLFAARVISVALLVAVLVLATTSQSEQEPRDDVTPATASEPVPFEGEP